MSIRFGTSGWRAAIADDFTFAGVRQVTEAICTRFESTASTNIPMVVGHDTRFLGERLAAECAEIGELINEDKTILGGKESAGLSIKGHYPEKDGILACLLAAEAVAARGASLTGQRNALCAQLGKLEAGRIGVRMTPELMGSLGDKLKQDAAEIGGRRVEKTNRTDGVKFISRMVHGY